MPRKSLFQDIVVPSALVPLSEFVEKYSLTIYEILLKLPLELLPVGKEQTAKTFLVIVHELA